MPRSWRERESGQGAVEFALTLPIVTLLILGIIEMGFVFSAYGAIVFGAREGARAAAIYQSATTCSQGQNDSNRESGTGCSPAYSDSVRASVDRSLGWLKRTAPNFNKDNLATDSAAPGVTISYPPPNSGKDSRAGDLVTVEVGYRYSWLTAALNLPPIILHGSSTVRLEP